MLCHPTIKHCSCSRHQKCSTGPKASSREINWNCGKYAKIMQQSSSANITQPPAPTNTTPSQQLPTQSWDKLTIIQWNADRIRLKMLELRDKLINWDIGIVVIQESKLWKTNKTPFIEGYATIRKDKTAFLAMVSYSLSAMRWFSKSYNLSKKQAWKS